MTIHENQLVVVVQTANKFRRLSLKVFVAIAIISACDTRADLFAVDSQTDQANGSWPPIHFTSKPWTYWYWMGGAVDEAGITHQLEKYREAGLGGVHIVPVYGVRGAEKHYINFLSNRWMALLKHAVDESGRLGMGIDMTCGTGWPFGGPWVHPPHAAAEYVVEEYLPLDSVQFDVVVRPQKDRFKIATLVIVMAAGPNAPAIDLTSKVDSAGRLRWSAPANGWKVSALFQTPTNLPVERAAPGGEGLTLDHFDHAALDDYLAKFNEAFDSVPNLRVRAFYNDSYENWGQNWTPKLFDQFSHRRGYDLRHHLAQLAQSDTSNEAQRVRADYRETMADMVRDEFTRPWVEWAHAHQTLVRNEGHGSPGNPLDLYALADVPETEVFGTSWLEPLGLKPLPGVPERQGGAPEVQVCKFASSAAHVAGRPLCSSETCTWLGDHFKIPLEHMKSQADLMFVMGINHIFFHGSAYSPTDAPWPGWLWYAATNVGEYSSSWEHMPALCNYIARCQANLQSGHPDNDALVYLPIYDLWATDDGSRDNLQYTAVHFTPVWLEKLMPGFASVGHTLWSRGFSFDCISDLQIASLSVEDGRLVSPGGKYRVLIIPECQLMSEKTMLHLARIVQAGGTVVVDKKVPADVPGLGDLDKRRAEFSRSVAQLEESRWSHDEQTTASKGRFVVANDLEHGLSELGVSREPLVDLGLKFIRRLSDKGWTYFIVNHSGAPVERWVHLSVPSVAVEFFDPATGRTGAAAQRETGKESDVFLQLQERQSVIVRTLSNPSELPCWKYLHSGEAKNLTGPWDVEFVRGGPTLPERQHIAELSDWTQWQLDNSKLRQFSGTARYSLHFEKPDFPAAGWTIDLGEVCHSAKVRLNGRDLGIAICSPFRLDCSDAIRPGKNALEVEVANLPANRIADLDRRGVDWKKFLFVDIRYQPFDASRWEPVRSGMIGPVTLIAERAIQPAALEAK